jgi:hypothetical protein
VGVERLPFDDALEVEREVEGTYEFVLPDGPGLKFDLMALSGGPDRSPSAFRFVPLLVSMELLMAGRLTSLVASAADFVGFAGVGFWAGFGGAGDWPVPIEPRTSLKKLIVVFRKKKRSEQLLKYVSTADGL